MSKSKICFEIPEIIKMKLRKGMTLKVNSF